jgi:hypothetical protein
MGRRFEAAYINTLPAINKSIGPSGIGTITFENTDRFAFYGNTGVDFFAPSSGTNALTFYDIKDAKQVYEEVNNLRNRQDDRIDKEN